MRLEHYGFQISDYLTGKRSPLSQTLLDQHFLNQDFFVVYYHDNYPVGFKIEQDKIFISKVGYFATDTLLRSELTYQNIVKVVKNILTDQNIRIVVKDTCY